MGNGEARAVRHFLTKVASRPGSVGGAGHSHGGCISQQHRVPGLIRRNQHALRAVSRRTPTPVLLPLLRACSFRLVDDAARVPLPLRLGSVAPLLPPAPDPLPPESLRLPSPTPNRSDTTKQEIGGEAEGLNRRISREAQHPHWQNQTVPLAPSIVWLARAVKVERPFP